MDQGSARPGLERRHQVADKRKTKEKAIRKQLTTTPEQYLASMKRWRLDVLLGKAKERALHARERVADMERQREAPLEKEEG